MDSGTPESIPESINAPFEEQNPAKQAPKVPMCCQNGARGAGGRGRSPLNKNIDFYINCW